MISFHWIEPALMSVVVFLPLPALLTKAILVNELQETADLDTPERAKNLLEFAEDMEDSDGGD